jgi:hypothetical protein
LIDYTWQDNGGILLDGSGDIALSSADGYESLLDMVRTRLKAAVNGWKLYSIGAGLDRFRGEMIDTELELMIKRQVAEALQLEFLPRGMFQVEALPAGNRIHVLVYLDGALAATAVVSQDGVAVQ